MRLFRSIVAAVALAAATLGASGADAQLLSRNMANNLLMEGKAHLDAGEYVDAATSFQGVLDLDDADHEASDLKAVAGVFLCLARAKNNQLEAARSACNMVLQMRDAPQQTKDQAARLLAKLN